MQELASVPCRHAAASYHNQARWDKVGRDRAGQGRAPFDPRRPKIARLQHDIDDAAGKADGEGTRVAGEQPLGGIQHRHHAGSLQHKAQAQWEGETTQGGGGAGSNATTGRGAGRRMRASCLATCSRTALPKRGGLSPPDAPQCCVPECTHPYTRSGGRSGWAGSGPAKTPACAARP